MKKVLPFIFPLVALVIVVFLAMRWYSHHTTRPQGETSQTEFAEGEKIEDLSASEAGKLRRPVRDLSTVDLKGSDSASGSGQVRYEISDGKLYFSVIANLPHLDQGFYQVWLKDPSSDSRKKAFTLQENKGGFMGDGAISASTLPFDVVVTKKTVDDDELGDVMLQGSIQKDNSSNQ